MVADRIPGRATPEGTARYAARHWIDARHAATKTRDGLWLSSVGAGTCLGEPGDSAAYRGALACAMRSGINVFDTSINYRMQASERDLGAALLRAVESGEMRRDEVVVCTKGGFLALDHAETPENPRKYLADHYLGPGLCPPDQIVDGCQCLAPGFLDDQFERSLGNLGLQSLDYYLLHNPEVQLKEVSRPEFLRRVRLAFEVLASKVAEGKLGSYGVSSWDGFRGAAGSDGLLDLDELLRAASAAEGPNHHFRVVELPFNLAMSEALGVLHPNPDGEARCILEMAAERDLVVLASASLMQGNLDAFPEALAPLFPGCETAAQRSLQHGRSAPGVSCALAGARQRAHVEENAAVLGLRRMPGDMVRKLHGMLLAPQEPPPA